MNASPELDPNVDDEPTPTDLADSLASDAALAYATTIGAFELIDRFRFSDPARPVPAPGADDLPDLARGHAFDAIHAAASAHHATDDATARALERVHRATADARRTLQRLARIGLGVAQHSYDNDDVELVERAMIGILFPAEWEHASVFDEVPLVGRRRDEVSVELAGLIALAIVEQSPQPGVPLVLALRSPGVDPITVTVAGDHVAVDDDAFAAPVTIVEVTELILSRITATDPTAIARITVDPVGG